MLIAYQLSKFILIGISNTVISYLAFITACNFLFHDSVFISQCISYAAGMIWSFTLNSRWTFAGSQQSLKSFLSFITVQFTLLLTSALFIQALVTYFSLNKSLAWICVMAFITVINFVASKYIVFKM